MKETLEELQNIPPEMLMHLADEHILNDTVVSVNEDIARGLTYSAKFLRENGADNLADALLQKYKLQEIPVYDINESEFFSRIKDAGLVPQVQGYMTVGTGKEAIKYPIVLLSGDVMRYEIAFQKLKETLKQELINNESNS